MGRKKVPVYLPLTVCRHVMKQSLAYTAEEMRVFVEACYTEQQKQDAVNGYVRREEEAGRVPNVRAFTDFTSDDLMQLDFYSMIMLWAKSKQVYRFDKDFTEELLRTENLRYIKDSWNYLPYSVFFVDISDNAELCERLKCMGFFLKAVYNSLEDNWKIHLYRLDGEMYHHAIFTAENKDTVFRVEELGEFADEDYDNECFGVLVVQILTYLASVEPDVQESEESKAVYRKPAEDVPPKNSYHEIRKWDVGVRFGNAFRKWQSDKAVTGKATGTGARLRPHCRRAHWHNYWYKTADGGREKRLKWVSECFVNVEDSEQDLPVTIHNTGGSL